MANVRASFAVALGLFITAAGTDCSCWSTGDTCNTTIPYVDLHAASGSGSATPRVVSLSIVIPDDASTGFGTDPNQLDAFYTAMLNQPTLVTAQFCYADWILDAIPIVSLYRGCMSGDAPSSGFVATSTLPPVDHADTSKFCIYFSANVQSAGNITIVTEFVRPLDGALNVFLAYECPCGTGPAAGAGCDQPNVIQSTGAWAGSAGRAVGSTLASGYDLLSIGSKQALFEVRVPYDHMTLRVDGCNGVNAATCGWAVGDGGDGGGSGSSVDHTQHYAIWRDSCFAGNMNSDRQLQMQPSSMQCSLTGGSGAFVTGLSSGNYSFAFGYPAGVEGSYQLDWSLQCDCGWYGPTCSTQLPIQGIAAMSGTANSTIVPTISSGGGSVYGSGNAKKFLRYTSHALPGTSALAVGPPPAVIRFNACPANTATGGVGNAQPPVTLSVFGPGYASAAECPREGVSLDDMNEQWHRGIVPRQSSPAVPLLGQTTTQAAADASASERICERVVYPTYPLDGSNVPPGDFYVMAEATDPTVPSIGLKFDISWSASCPCYTKQNADMPGSYCAVSIPYVVADIDGDADDSRRTWQYSAYVGNTTLAVLPGDGLNAFDGPAPQAYFVLPLPVLAPHHVSRLIATTCTNVTASRDGVKDTRLWLSLSCPAGGYPTSGLMGVIAYNDDAATGQVCSTSAVEVEVLNDRNTAAIHAIVDSRTGASGLVGLSYRWECACGWGGNDCGTHLNASVFHALSLDSAAAAAMSTASVTVSFDTTDTGASTNIIGQASPDVIFNLTVPSGLPAGTRISITTGTDTTFASANGGDTILYLLRNDRSAHCLAGGVQLSDLAVVAMSDDVDADSSFSQIDIVDPLPGRYFVAVEFKPAAGTSGAPVADDGALQYSIICPCGYHGPTCTPLESLPAIPPAGGTSTLQGATTMHYALFPSDDGTTYVANYQLQVINRTAGVWFDSCTAGSFYGFRGKTPAVAVAMALRSVCEFDDRFGRLINSEPTVVALGMANVQYAGTDGFGCSQMSNPALDPGLYHLSVTTPTSPGVFEVDYSLLYQCACGQVAGSCCGTTVPVTALSASSAGTVTGTLPNYTQPLDNDFPDITGPSLHYSMTLPPDWNNDNMTIHLDTCNAVTKGGAWGTTLRLWSRCVASGPQPMNLLSVADGVPSYTTCGGIQGLIGSWLDTHVALAASDQAANLVAGSTIGIELFASPRTTAASGANALISPGGRFSLSYSLACRCGKTGAGCNSSLPVYTATGLSGSITADISSRGVDYYGATGAPEVYIRYIADASLTGGSPPAAITFTTCPSSAADTMIYVMAAGSCPAGRRDRSSVTVIASNDNVDSSKTCSTVTVPSQGAETWVVVERARGTGGAFTLSWTASCGCNAGDAVPSGAKCSVPLSPAQLLPTTAGGYSGSSAIITIPSTPSSSRFGGASNEVVLSWPKPLQDPAADGNVASINFSTCNEVTKGTGGLVDTTLYAVPGCVASGYWLPGATPGTYPTALFPASWTSTDVATTDKCSRIVLSSANVTSLGGMPAGISVVVEGGASAVANGKTRVDWSYRCKCGWGGTGCAQPVQAPVLLSWPIDNVYAGVAQVDTSDDAYVDVTGAPSPDAWFSFAWAAKTQSITVTSCPGGTTDVMDTSITILEGPPKLSVTGSLPPTAAGSASARSMCLAGGSNTSVYTVVATARNSTSGSCVSVKITSPPSIATNVFYAVVEGFAADGGAAAGGISVAYSHACQCGWAGSTCNTPITTTQLTGSNGTLVSTISPLSSNTLMTSHPMNLYAFTVPAGIPVKSLLRLSTCSKTTNDGMRDTVLSVYSSCFGGGRDMTYYPGVGEPDTGLATVYDDTFDCSYSVLYDVLRETSEVSPLRSQATIVNVRNNISGIGVAGYQQPLTAGQTVYFSIQGYDVRNVGAFQLTYEIRCLPGYFGSGCTSQPAPINILNTSTGLYTARLPTAAASNYIGSGSGDVLFSLPMMFPPGRATFTTCNPGTSIATGIRASNIPWSGPGPDFGVVAFNDNAGASFSPAGCSSITYAPTTKNLQVEVSGTSASASGNVAVSWAVTCHCHKESSSDPNAKLCASSMSGAAKWPFMEYGGSYTYKYGAANLWSVARNRWGGLAPQVVATWVNPALDGLTKSMVNLLDKAWLTTCHPGTTGATGVKDTVMYAMSRCVAGGYASLEEIGTLAVNDDTIITNADGSVTNMTCSTLELSTSFLDNKEYMYTDLVIEPKLPSGVTNASAYYGPAATIEYGMSFQCKCGYAGYDCTEEIEEQVTDLVWAPSAHTAVIDAHTADGVDIVFDQAMERLFRIRLPPGTASFDATTCQDPAPACDAGQLLDSRVTLLRPNGHPSNDVDGTCIAGGRPATGIPILADGRNTTTSTGEVRTCATVTYSIPSNRVPWTSSSDPALQGWDEYVIMVGGDKLGSPCGGNGPMRLTVHRACACGRTGPDCSVDESHLKTGTLTGLTGYVSGDTSAGSTTWFADAPGAGALLGTGPVSLYTIVVPSQAAALVVHTCSALTSDPVLGVEDTVVNVYSGTCSALGQLAATLPYASNGQNKIAGSVLCPASPQASFVRVPAPSSGLYSVTVSAERYRSGFFGLSWYIQCACGFVGTTCDVTAPASASVALSSSQTSVTLLSMPNAATLHMDGRMYRGFMLSYTLQTAPAQGSQAVYITTCTSMTLTQRAPAALALSNSSGTCLGSGTPLSSYGLLASSSPAADDSCSSLSFTGLSGGPQAALVAFDASSVSATAQVAVDVVYGCACGLFGPSCSTPAAVVPIAADSTRVASATASVPSTPSYYGSASSGEAYFSIAVPKHASSVTIETCNAYTASNIRDTKVYASLRCPSGTTTSTPAAFNEVVTSNDDAAIVSGDGALGCSAITIGRVASGNTVFIVVEGSTNARTGADQRGVQVDVTIECDCGRSGPNCDAAAAPITMVTTPGFTSTMTIDKGIDASDVAIFVNGNEILPLQLRISPNTAKFDVTTCTPATKAGTGSATFTIASASQSLCDASASLPVTTSASGAGNGTCTTASLSLPSAGNYQVMVHAGNMPGEGTFGIQTTVVCSCGYGGDGTSCTQPMGIPAVDSSGNVVANGRIELDLRSAAPVFGASTQALVVQLVPPTNSNGDRATFITLTTNDDVTTSGIQGTVITVVKGCIAGGLPFDRQQWNVLYTERGVKTSVQYSTYRLVDTSASVYYVIIEGYGGRTGRLALKWDSGVPSPSPSPVPSGTWRPPSPTSSPTQTPTPSTTPSPTPLPIVEAALSLKGVPASVLLQLQVGKSFRQGMANASGQAMHDVRLQSIEDHVSGRYYTLDGNTIELNQINNDDSVGGRVLAYLAGSASSMRQTALRGLQLIGASASPAPATPGSNVVSRILARAPPPGSNSSNGGGSGVNGVSAASVIAAVQQSLSNGSFFQSMPAFVAAVQAAGHNITSVSVEVGIARAPVVAAPSDDGGSGVGIAIGAGVGGAIVVVGAFITMYCCFGKRCQSRIIALPVPMNDNPNSRYAKNGNLRNRIEFEEEDQEEEEDEEDDSQDEDVGKGGKRNNGKKRDGSTKFAAERDGMISKATPTRGTKADKGTPATSGAQVASGSSKKGKGKSFVQLDDEHDAPSNLQVKRKNLKSPGHNSQSPDDAHASPRSDDDHHHHEDVLVDIHTPRGRNHTDNLGSAPSTARDVRTATAASGGSRTAKRWVDDADADAAATSAVAAVGSSSAASPLGISKPRCFLAAKGGPTSSSPASGAAAASAAATAAALRALGVDAYDDDDDDADNHDGGGRYETRDEAKHPDTGGAAGHGGGAADGGEKKKKKKVKKSTLAKVGGDDADAAADDDGAAGAKPDEKAKVKKKKKKVTEATNLLSGGADDHDHHDADAVLHPTTAAADDAADERKHGDDGAAAGGEKKVKKKKKKTAADGPVATTATAGDTLATDAHAADGIDVKKKKKKAKKEIGDDAGAADGGGSKVKSGGKAAAATAAASGDIGDGLDDDLLGLHPTASAAAAAATSSPRHATAKAAPAAGGGDWFASPPSHHSSSSSPRMAGGDGGGLAAPGSAESAPGSGGGGRPKSRQGYAGPSNFRGDGGGGTATATQSPSIATGGGSGMGTLWQPNVTGSPDRVPALGRSPQQQQQHRDRYPISPASPNPFSDDDDNGGAGTVAAAGADLFGAVPVTRSSPERLSPLPPVNLSGRLTMSGRVATHLQLPAITRPLGLASSGLPSAPARPAAKDLQLLNDDPFA